MVCHPWVVKATGNVAIGFQVDSVAACTWTCTARIASVAGPKAVTANCEPATVVAAGWSTDRLTLAAMGTGTGATEACARTTCGGTTAGGAATAG